MCPHCERDSDWMAIYERGGSTVERQRRDPPHVVLFRDAVLRVKRGRRPYGSSADRTGDRAGRRDSDTCRRFSSAVDLPKECFDDVVGIAEGRRTNRKEQIRPAAYAAADPKQDLSLMCHRNLKTVLR